MRVQEDPRAAASFASCAHRGSHPSRPFRRYECKLCLTLHNNEGNYLAHTQGKRHQQNLAKRAARDAADAPSAPAPAKRKTNARKLVKIGRPGYRVTKQFDAHSSQRSLLFQVDYPEIEDGVEPRHRFMSRCVWAEGGAGTRTRRATHVLCVFLFFSRAFFSRRFTVTNKKWRLGIKSINTFSSPLNRTKSLRSKCPTRRLTRAAIASLRIGSRIRKYSRCRFISRMSEGVLGVQPHEEAFLRRRLHPRGCCPDRLLRRHRRSAVWVEGYRHRRRRRHFLLRSRRHRVCRRRHLRRHPCEFRFLEYRRPDGRAWVGRAFGVLSCETRGNRDALCKIYICVTVRVQKRGTKIPNEALAARPYIARALCDATPPHAHVFRGVLLSTYPSLRSSRHPRRSPASPPCHRRRISISRTSSPRRRIKRIGPARSHAPRPQR